MSSTACAEAVELRRLAALATMPSVAKMLEQKAADLTAAAAAAAATVTIVAPSPPPSPSPSPGATAGGGGAAAGDAATASDASVKKAPRLIQKKITTYGWDQTKDAIKLYISLPEVDALPAAAITLQTEAKRMTLSVAGLGGKGNLRHTLIVILSKPVIAEECTHRVRKGKVYVTLKKKDTGATWPYLTAAEQDAANARAPKTGKGGKADADGSEDSLMEMMRNMYQNGDDDMKQLIGKAWTDGKKKEML